jgi:hypothetical protein
MARAQVVLGQPNPDDDRPGIMVHSPYSDDFREEVKQLPPGDRRWVPYEEGWWVAEEHMDWIRDRVQHHFSSYELVDKDGTIETFSAGAHTRQERLF